MENSERYHFTSSDNPDDVSPEKASHVTGAEKKEKKESAEQDITKNGAINIYNSNPIPQMAEPDNDKRYTYIFFCYLITAVLMSIYFCVTISKINGLEKEMTEFKHELELSENTADMHDDVYQEKFRRIMKMLDDIEDGIEGLKLNGPQGLSEGEWVENTDGNEKSFNHGWIGVQVIDIDPAGLKAGLPIGAYVEAVIEGGAAEKAGIQPDDVITGFNGKAIAGVNDLLDEISLTVPGDKVELNIMRRQDNAYSPMTVKITMGENPEMEEQ